LSCSYLINISYSAFITISHINKVSPSGMLSMVILATYPGTRKRFQRVCDDFYSGMSCKSITSSALGGLLIGIGMPIAGSVRMYPGVVMQATQVKLHKFAICLICQLQAQHTDQCLKKLFIPPLRKIYEYICSYSVYVYDCQEHVSIGDDKCVKYK